MTLRHDFNDIDWEQVEANEANTPLLATPLENDWIQVETVKYILCFRGANHPHDGLKDGLHPRQVGPIKYHVGIDPMTCLPVTPLLEVAAYFPEHGLDETKIDVVLIPLPQKNDDIFASRIPADAKPVDESESPFINTSSAQKLDALNSWRSDEHFEKDCSELIWSHELATNDVTRENVVATLKCMRQLGSFTVTEIVWQDEAVVNPDFLTLGYKERLATYLQLFHHKTVSFYNDTDYRLSSKGYKGFFDHGNAYLDMHKNAAYQYYLDIAHRYCDEHKLHYKHGDNLRLMKQCRDPDFDVDEFCKALSTAERYFAAYKAYCDRYNFVLKLKQNSQLEQLLLLQDITHPEQTSRALERAMVRHKVVDLLFNNNDTLYDILTAPQSPEEKLTLDQYSGLRDLLHTSPPETWDLLWTTTTVTHSEQTKQLARQFGVNPSLRREAFLSITTQQCPSIYPEWHDMDAEEKAYFPFAFLEKSDVLAMLFTSGGHALFDAVKARIAAASMTRAQYEFWFSRWIIEVAAYQQETPTGSAFLTARVAMSLLTLKQELDQLWENPAHDVLTAYLTARQAALGVDNLFLSHLGALMQWHKAEEGALLQTWFNTVSVTNQNNMMMIYQRYLTQAQQPASHVHKLWQTLCVLSDDVAERLSIFSLLITEAYRLSGDTNQPLSFKTLQSADTATRIVEIYRATQTIPAINLTPTGDVILTDPATLHASYAQ